VGRVATGVLVLVCTVQRHRKCETTRVHVHSSCRTSIDVNSNFRSHSTSRYRMQIQCIGIENPEYPRVDRRRSRYLDVAVKCTVGFSLDSREAVDW
jgi:hypothetical protein